MNNDTEKHKSRPKSSHTIENCIIVEGLIREDRRVDVSEIRKTHWKKEQLSNTSHPVERNATVKKCVKLVKRWNKYLYANGDYFEKENIFMQCFFALLKVLLQ
jgi:hypothetical protein